MFSNQSVVGHPSPAGIAIAAMPESATVFDMVNMSFQVAGGVTPASDRALVEYHTTDLLAAL